MLKYILITGLLVGCGGSKSSKSKGPSKPPAPPKEGTIKYGDVSGIIENHCLPCHGGSTPRAGLKLDNETDLRRNVSKALGRINGGTMPPDDSGKDKVSKEDAEKLAKFSKGE